MLALEKLSPMLLVSGDSHPIADDRGWAYEAKWDGFRVLVAFGPSGVRVRSRHGTDFTEAFPELAGLSTTFGGTEAIVDGELVCFGPNGRTSFAAIRRRWGPGCRMLATTFSRRHPATLAIFDILELGGRSMMSLPYQERRETLGRWKDKRSQHWLVTDFHVGQGQALTTVSRELGLEGIVAKRLTSGYHPGVRSNDWRKIKNFQRGDFIVGGWLPGKGGGIEALYVGHQTRGTTGLLFDGTVELGVGWHGRRLGEALALLASHDSPFANWTKATRARWVKPHLVAKIRFIGWDAGVLREPILEGLDVIRPA